MSRHVRPQDLKPSPLSRRLVRRMRESGFTLPGSVENYALQGQSPGHNQKSAGAWAWELYTRRRSGTEWRPMSVGSSDPASSLRKNTEITSFTNAGDLHLCFEKPRKPSRWREF